MKKLTTVVFLACLVLNVWSACAALTDDGRPDSSAPNANKDIVVEGLILQVSKLPNPQSSIAVIGNSFLQTPHDKSFGNWLYYLTGIRPFTVCFSAMGVKTFGIVELVRNTQKLKNVKLVVLYIGTEFFNGSRFAAKRTAFDFESVKTITELFR